MKVRKIILVTTSILILNGTAFAADNPAGKTYSGTAIARTNAQANKEAENKAVKNSESACKSFCNSLGKTFSSVNYDGDSKAECGKTNNNRVSCTVSKTVKECICRERTASEADASEPGNILEQFDPLSMEF